jgi:ERCC4-type nuclease
MTSKQASICMNKFNEFYYKEFSQLAKEAKEKNNSNLSLIYKKVAHSIQKYPMPLLTASQAMLLEGVGETISKKFEEIMLSYREKIEKESMNYLEMAYEINQNFNERKKGGKRKAQTDTEPESKIRGAVALETKSDLKKRKKLVNIEMYSSIWSSVVCCYILHLQTNSLIFEFDDIVAMSRTLSEELKSVKNIEVSQGKEDFKEMKNLNLLENVDLKEKKIKITDFLIKLAKIELKKSGILVENDGYGQLNFTITEEEKCSDINDIGISQPYFNSNINLITQSQVNNNFQNPNSNIREQMPVSVNNFNLSTGQQNNNIRPISYTINKNDSRPSSLNNSFSQKSSKGKKSEEIKNTTLDNYFNSKKKFKEEDNRFSFNLLPVNQEESVDIKNNNDNNFQSTIISSGTNVFNNNLDLHPLDNSTNKFNIKTSLHSGHYGPSYSNINNHNNNFNNISLLSTSSNISVNNIQSNSNNNFNFNSKSILPVSANSSTSSHILKKRLLDFKKSKPKIPQDNIFLIVDNREKGPKGEKFPEEILKIRPDIQVKEGNLAVGDFMWTYIDPENGLEFVLDFIIERKTIEDLAKSILDGRYNEQKYRLKNCGIRNIYYFFEGSSYTLPRGNISKSAITTAIFNTLNIHDINIVKSSSIEDSVNFLIKMDDIIRKNAEMYSTISLNTNNDYSQFQPEILNKVLLSEFTQSNAKTKNSSIENIFVRQLRCFDDCGAKSVDVLRKVFKCPKFIFEIVSKIDCEETKENLITVASYLSENNLELTEDNIINYARPENFKFLKKEVKSVKKIRKTTNTSIISFYS